MGDGVIRWQFSLKDFQKGYSTYTLRAVSRTLQVPAIGAILTVVAVFLVLMIVALAGMKQGSLKRKPKK